MRGVIRRQTRPIAGVLAVIGAVVNILGAAALGAASLGGGRRVFASGFDRPQAVAELDAGSVLVAERSGRILLLRAGARVDLGKIEVPGLSIFYVPETAFTEGLKDLVVLAGRRDSFLWCATTGSRPALRWTVGRAMLDSTHTGRPTMRSEVLWQSDPQPWTRSSPPPFSACRIAVDGPDVLVAMGANGRGTASGRIMRISPSGDRAPQVVSTGHRNPAGIVILSGRVWEIEHGPKGGDELNVIKPGGDYGWSAVSEGEPDDAHHRSFARERPGSIGPVTTWTPAIAPSGMAPWRGTLVVSALRGRSIEQVTVNGAWVVSRRRLLQFDVRVRDVRASGDGKALWVLTDGPAAELLRLVPN